MYKNSVNKFVFTLVFTVLVISMMSQPVFAKEKDTKPIYKIITQINTQIEKKDWKAASEYTDKLDKYYGDNRWKFQLMGDKPDYLGIERDIIKLKSAIKAKDKTQSLVTTADISALFKRIYHF